jgi:nitroreductase
LAGVGKVCYFVEKNLGMELYEGLIARRSIRRYTGEKISTEAIERIVKAGMYAPSARNTRPWHFVIIDDRTVMKKITEFHPYASMLLQASHAIAVCGDELLHNGPGYYPLDCSAATENILLAAHALGYGAVWVGIHPKPDRIKALSELLGLPEHVHPVSLISVGVPEKVTLPQPQRFEKEKIRYNHW